MRELTQTSLDPGNCWQTAWACVLDVDPKELPDQAALPGPSENYCAPLQAYLRVHHHKLLLTIGGVVPVSLLRPRSDDPHVLVGPTVRSRDTWHCVVGRGGETIWDPHPSRAGLLCAAEMQLLMPHEEGWPPRDYPPCVCPACAHTPEAKSAPSRLVSRVTAAVHEVFITTHFGPDRPKDGGT